MQPPGDSSVSAAVRDRASFLVSGGVDEGLKAKKEILDTISLAMVCLRRCVGKDSPDEVKEKAFKLFRNMPDSEVVEVATDLLRCTRNLCANGDKMQKEIRKVCLSNVLEILEMVSDLDEGGLGGAWKNKVEMMARVAVQNVVNMHVGCEDVLFMEETRFLEIWKKHVGYGLERESVLLLRNLMQCLLTLTEGKKSLRASFCSDENAPIFFMKCAAFCLSKLNSQDQEEHEYEAGIHDLHGALVWNAGGFVNSGLGEIFLNASQDVMLSLWIGHRIEEEELFDFDEDAALDSEMLKSYEAVEKTYLNLVIQRRRNGDNIFDVSTTEHLCLRLIGSHSQDRRVFVKSKNRLTLIREVLSEIRVAEANKELVPFRFRVDLVRIVANAVHRNPEIQDLVRSVPDGIYAILNQCNIDENSPFLREWGILAVRNLCEGNEANQQVIADLQTQGVVQDSLLEGAGLRVELPEGDDGKPKIVRM